MRLRIIFSFPHWQNILCTKPFFFFCHLRNRERRLENVAPFVAFFSSFPFLSSPTFFTSSVGRRYEKISRFLPLLFGLSPLFLSPFAPLAAFAAASVLQDIFLQVRQSHQVNDCQNLFLLFQDHLMYGLPRYSL